MTSTQQYISWLEARLDAARGIPSDDFLIAVAMAGCLALLFMLAWLRAARRASSATHKLAQLETELANVRATLDAEVRWRMAAATAVRNRDDPSAIKPAVEGR